MVESPCEGKRWRSQEFDPYVRKIPWRRKWQPTLKFLPGKFHRQRSLEGYSPWGCKESDMTEYAHILAIIIFPLLTRQFLIKVKNALSNIYIRTDVV